MRNLAFEITNALLNNKLIIEDVSPRAVQAIVQYVLDADPRLREKIVHLTHDTEPICHSGRIGSNLATTRDTKQVTCLRCLKSIRSS